MRAASASPKGTRHVGHLGLLGTAFRDRDNRKGQEPRTLPWGRQTIGVPAGALGPQQSVRAGHRPRARPPHRARNYGGCIPSPGGRKLRKEEAWGPWAPSTQVPDWGKLPHQRENPSAAGEEAEPAKAPSQSAPKGHQRTGRWGNSPGDRWTVALTSPVNHPTCTHSPTPDSTPLAHQPGSAWPHGWSQLLGPPRVMASQTGLHTPHPLPGQEGHGGSL